MGTGIVSILIHQLPYNAPWLRGVSVAFFVLNICLFSIFTVMSIVRYVLYPEIWTAMLAHPAQSLFLGCFPMGFASACPYRLSAVRTELTLLAIINMMIISCSQWGDWMVYWAWGFWWVDVVLSLATCVSMPFIV
jgi:tellurite resistance protein TehA-like permease